MLNTTIPKIRALGESISSESVRICADHLIVVGDTKLIVRSIKEGPWSGGLSIRPHDSFPRWNLIITSDGSVIKFDEGCGGIIGAATKLSFPTLLQLFPNWPENGQGELPRWEE